MLRYTYPKLTEQNNVTLEVSTVDLISKKELLALTGISYGQLYRWKRERLIPEEWFIKQSAYTGQETFFPRQQILSRVQTILDAKDRYSLDELSRLLSPETSPGFRSAEGLKTMEELEPALLPVIQSLYGKENYEFADVVLFAGVSLAGRALALSGEAMGELLVKAASAAIPLQKLTDLNLTAFRAEGRIHVLLSKTAAPFALDSDLEVLGSWDLGELAGRLKLKY